MGNFENKTVIVTGASRGLGKQIALEFAKKGAAVVINYSSAKEEAGKVVNEIKLAGGRAISVQADVSNAADVERLFDEASRQFGKIDIVVNNAGVMITKLLQDVSEADFDRQFAINTKSVFLVLKQAVEKLENGGRIVTISSSTSRLMMPGYSVYSATKAAVEQLSKVVAKEVGYRDITVNCVLPGPINTALFRNGKSTELIGKIAGLSAFNRIGEPEDIVPVILFLASKEAQWITGQTIGANGGMA